MLNILEKDGPEKIEYKGKIFEIIKQPMKIGGKKIIFEIARRSPGVRLIIVKGNQILITKEYRSELNDYDYRLPGGKVFDTLDEYNLNRDTDMLSFTVDAAKRECREETWLVVKNIRHFATSVAGATVKWNLEYYIIDEFEENTSGQNLEDGEIISVEWKSFEEVRELCKQWRISEDRTIWILFRFFLNYHENY